MPSRKENLTNYDEIHEERLPYSSVVKSNPKPNTTQMITRPKVYASASNVNGFKQQVTDFTASGSSETNFEGAFAHQPDSLHKINRDMVAGDSHFSVTTDL